MPPPPPSYYAPEPSGHYSSSRPIPPVSGVPPYYEPRPAYDSYTPDISVPTSRGNPQPAAAPTYQQPPSSSSSYYRPGAPTTSLPPPTTSSPYDNRRPYDANPGSQTYYANQALTQLGNSATKPTAANPYSTANLASLLQATSKIPETTNYAQPSSNAVNDYYRSSNPVAYGNQQPSTGYNPYPNSTPQYGNPSYGVPAPTQAPQGQYNYLQSNYPTQNAPNTSNNKDQPQQQAQYRSY